MWHQAAEHDLLAGLEYTQTRRDFLILTGRKRLSSEQFPLQGVMDRVAPPGARRRREIAGLAIGKGLPGAIHSSKLLQRLFFG